MDLLCILKVQLILHPLLIDIILLYMKVKNIFFKIIQLLFNILLIYVKKRILNWIFKHPFKKYYKYYLRQFTKLSKIYVIFEIIKENLKTITFILGKKIINNLIEIIF